VTSSAVSRFMVIRTINVKTIRCVCSYRECSAHWSPAAMARRSL